MDSSKHVCISALVNLESAVSMMQRLVVNVIGSVDHEPSNCSNRNAHCTVHSSMPLEYIMSDLYPSDPFRRYYQPKILYAWNSSMNATFLNNFVSVTLRKHKGRNSEPYPFMVTLRLRSPGTSSLYRTPEYIRLFVLRNVFIFIFDCATVPSGLGLPQYRGFTLRHTRLTRNPLDK